MARKNWKMILELPEDKWCLRDMLIMSEGTIADCLQEGFPEYFLDTDEAQEDWKPSLDDVLLIASKVNAQTLVKILQEEFGLITHIMLSQGTWAGETDGFPLHLGVYTSPDIGYLTRFLRSNWQSGNIVEWSNERWLVAANHFEEGEFGLPDKQIIVLLNEHSLQEVQNVLCERS